MNTYLKTRTFFLLSLSLVSFNLLALPVDQKAQCKADASFDQKAIVDNFLKNTYPKKYQEIVPPLAEKLTEAIRDNLVSVQKNFAKTFERYKKIYPPLFLEAYENRVIPNTNGLNHSANSVGIEEELRKKMDEIIYIDDAITSIEKYEYTDYLNGTEFVNSIGGYRDLSKIFSMKYLPKGYKMLENEIVKIKNGVKACIESKKNPSFCQDKTNDEWKMEMLIQAANEVNKNLYVPLDKVAAKILPEIEKTYFEQIPNIQYKYDCELSVIDNVKKLEEELVKTIYLIPQELKQYLQKQASEKVAVLRNNYQERERLLEAYKDIYFKGFDPVVCNQKYNEYKEVHEKLKLLKRVSNALVQAAQGQLQPKKDQTHAELFKTIVQDYKDLSQFEKLNPYVTTFESPDAVIAELNGDVSPLYYLVQNEKIDNKNIMLILDNLIENGFDINLPSGTNGSTPLMGAVIGCVKNFSESSCEIMNHMIEKGADPHKMNLSGDNLINMLFVVDPSAERFKGKSTQIQSNQMMVLKTMSENPKIDMKKMVNSTNKNGNTPIIYSVLASNLEATKFMIEKGADLSVKLNGVTISELLKAKGGEWAKLVP